MFPTAKTLREGLEQLVARLDPAVLRPGDAAELFREFTRMQKLCSGAAMRLSPRAAASGEWKDEGKQTPAEWIAKQSGVSVSSAASMLETGRRLTALPDTDEAVKKGELSLRQAEEIASAAAADPQAQSKLLHSARTEGFAGLKARCARVRAAACADEEERDEQIHRSRYLRYFSDELGAFCLQGRLSPQAGAAVVAALEPFRTRVSEEARKAGRRQTHETVLADALVAMAEDSRSSGPERRPGGGAAGMVHVTVDHAALVRGHTQNGETCEVPGIGPIPVAAAEALLADALLSVLVTDGADIKAVCNAGRFVPKRLRTALVVRDPVCVVPGCDKRHGLQIDHIDEFARGGPTRLENLARLCRWHHYLKTHQGYRLEGGPGEWSFLPPKEKSWRADQARQRKAVRTEKERAGPTPEYVRRLRRSVGGPNRSLFELINS